MPRNRRPRRARPRPVRLLAGDGDPVADPDATVAGPAEAVLLLLRHRIGPDDPRLTVSGSRATADAVLAAALTP